MNKKERLEAEILWLRNINFDDDKDVIEKANEIICVLEAKDRRIEDLEFKNTQLRRRLEEE